jgi:hypothetical protein
MTIISFGVRTPLRLVRVKLDDSETIGKVKQEASCFELRANARCPLPAIAAALFLLTTEAMSLITLIFPVQVAKDINVEAKYQTISLTPGVSPRSRCRCRATLASRAAAPLCVPTARPSCVHDLLLRRAMLRCLIRPFSRRWASLENCFTVFCPRASAPLLPAKLR